MQKIETQIKALTISALAEFGISTDPTEIHLEHPADTQFGDYSTNIAMKIFRQIDGTLKNEISNPRDFAYKITDVLNRLIKEKNIETLSSVSVAGPGFINFILSDQFLLNTLKRISDGEIEQTKKGKKIIVEFTDPNPFKEFHIGHLYSNTVGEAICRLLEAAGAEVQRVCYQGDVGMHVAKSVWGMRKKISEYPGGLDELSQKSLGEKVKFLGQSYALGATEFENNEQAKQEMKDINYMTFLSAQESLQAKIGWEPQVDYRKYLKETTLPYTEIKELFEKGRSWSLEYFDSIYHRLGMKFDDYYFESLVGEYGVKIIQEFLKKGIFKESQGAIIFPGSDYGLHDRVFINSLGLPTYECKELGLAPEKYRRFPYDESIIITGNEINEYFKVLLAALKATNPDLAVKTKHFSHGMVRLPEGKMSSRTGKVVTGEWLIEEAKAKVLHIFAETKSELAGAVADSTAEKVALGAIKYALLKTNLGLDIAFSFNESLSFQGNSGAYLQYTYARSQSVLKKHAASSPKNSGTTGQNIYDPNTEEKAVLRCLYQFNEVIQRATDEFAPHYVCTYLFELAQRFNTFYNKHHILGEDADANVSAVAQQNFRVELTSVTAQILQRGLSLLGIQVVVRM